jgi:hypothetical protein
MTPTEILALFQTARSLYEFGASQYRLAHQQGKLTEQQKTDILAAAMLTDDQVDTVVEAAKQRLQVSG